MQKTYEILITVNLSKAEAEDGNYGVRVYGKDRNTLGWAKSSTPVIGADIGTFFSYKVDIDIKKLLLGIAKEVKNET